LARFDRETTVHVVYLFLVVHRCTRITNNVAFLEPPLLYLLICDTESRNPQAATSHSLRSAINGADFNALVFGGCNHTLDRHVAEKGRPHVSLFVSNNILGIAMTLCGQAPAQPASHYPVQFPQNPSTRILLARNIVMRSSCPYASHWDARLRHQDHSKPHRRQMISVLVE
jgi:hypothetical protein